MIFPIRLYFCCITGNRWEELKINVKSLYDYVDNLIIVDGNYKECQITHDKLIKLDKDNKIVWVDYCWHDNFPEQRTKYLDTVGNLIITYKRYNEASYIIRLDDDEHFSIDTIKDLRKLCRWAESNQYDMLAIRCHGISLNKDNKRISFSIDNYHKGLIYKYYPKLKYIPSGWGGPVHETYNRQFAVKKVQEENKNSKYYYDHVKQQGEVWKRAHCRNFFIDGGGPNLLERQKLWKPFRALLNEIISPSPKTWIDYDNYLKVGNVDEKLKNWFIRYRLEGQINRDLEKYPLSETERELGINYDGASEVREGFLYYFGWLHPEELLNYSEEIIRNSPLDREIKEFYENKRLVRK